MNRISEQKQNASLNSNHIIDLKTSGLSDETIISACIRSISPTEASAILSFMVDSYCLLFPYFDIQRGDWGDYQRVKPDKPFTFDGSAAKYLSPKDAQNRLYVPVACLKVIKDPSTPLLITEGEKKTLKATQEGLYCIGLSGVWGWLTRSASDGGAELESHPIKDLDHIAWNGRQVRIVFDSDAARNSSVQLAASQLQNELHKRGAIVEVVFLPPGPRGAKLGLDDYLLIKSADSVWQLPCENTKLKTLVHNIRDSKRKPFEKRQKISNAIIRHCGKLGYFIHSSDDDYFYFCRPEKRLFLVDDESEGLSCFINNISGVNTVDPEFKHFIVEARQESATRGEQAIVHTFSHYDSATNRLYVYANNNLIYRLDGVNVTSVDNGTDGVLFRSDPTAETFEYIPDEKADGLLDKLILDLLNVEEKGVTRDEQQFLLLVYMLSLFFGSLLPTRPLLLFVGCKGSGKTTVLKLIGRLLRGRQFNVTSIAKEKEDAFVANICNRHFTAFDNVDGGIPWLNDALARVATGQTISRRRLYTTNSIVEYRPDTFIALSSRTPKFRRDDVVERLLLFPTKRINTFLNEHELLQRIDQNRNLLWTELLNALNEIIAKFPKIPSGQISSHRMADFADVGFRIATILGQSDHFLAILDKQQGLRSTFLLEEDPLLSVLSKWLVKASNKGRSVTAGILYDELSDLADGQFSYQNSQALAKRLKNIGDEISQLLGVNLLIGNGHDHQKSYIFQKKVQD